MSATPASISSPAGVGSLLGSIAGLGGSIYGLVNSASLQGTANSATSNIAAIQAQQLGYANQLQSLMANPSSVSSLPGYQFDLSQGTQAIDRSAAAPGGTGLGSGGEMTALESYGQGLASQFYNQQVSTLASLSGIPSSANALAQALQTSGAASTGLGSSISGLSGSISNLLSPNNISSIANLFSGGTLSAADTASLAADASADTDAATSAVSSEFADSGDLGDLSSLFSGFSSAGGAAATGVLPAGISGVIGAAPTTAELGAGAGALTADLSASTVSALGSAAGSFATGGAAGAGASTAGAGIAGAGLAAAGGILGLGALGIALTGGLNPQTTQDNLDTALLSSSASGYKQSAAGAADQEAEAVSSNTAANRFTGSGSMMGTTITAANAPATWNGQPWGGDETKAAQLWAAYQSGKGTLAAYNAYMQANVL